MQSRAKSWRLVEYHGNMVKIKAAQGCFAGFAISNLVDCNFYAEALFCALLCSFAQEKQESPPCKGSGMEVVWPSRGSSVDFFK